MSKIIKSARLICVSVATNNNKFYYLDLMDDDLVRIRYGRYLEKGGELQTQSDTTVPGGERLFESKIREKSRGGYKPQPLIEDNATAKLVKNAGLEDIALRQIRTSSADVRALISFLCGINIHNITSNSAIRYDANTGAFSTASGLITQQGIVDGRNLLSEIKTKVDAAQWDATYVDLLNRYLTIVPRDFGRKRPDPQTLFPDADEIQKQAGILDSLEASLTTALTKPAEDNKEPEPQPELFNTAIELLQDQKQFDAIKHHFESSAKIEHRTIAHLKLRNVYNVEIAGMKSAFEARGQAKGNIHRLWHGTSSANVLSIFKSGYMLTPPSTAHIAGKNFGNGLYFAPASTKSLQYSNGFWGGGAGARKIYMFLNDVAVGKAFEPKNTTSQNPPKGYDSYWAKAGSSGWLINDEVVVFDTAQANPVYLLEFE